MADNSRREVVALVGTMAAIANAALVDVPRTSEVGIDAAFIPRPSEASLAKRAKRRTRRLREVVFGGWGMDRRKAALRETGVPC